MKESISINEAVTAFETLVKEQEERHNMMAPKSKKAFEERDKIIIGTIAGDGIGPFIMEETQKVLSALLAKDKNRIELRQIEGLTIENRIALNATLPPEVLSEIRKCDVLLKGPTTTPDNREQGNNMESANVALRRELDLYANVRPVFIPEKNIDWMFFRENTEGEYVLGSRGIDLGDIAFDFKVTTTKGTRRIARAAFEYAKANGNSKVTIITKANIMKKTDGKFLKICYEVATEYPDVPVDDRYVDIMAANLVNPQIQSDFKVILAPNLYGDILTDEAAQLQGGVGTAGSGNIGDQYAMFEAIHGSAPRMVTSNRAEYANPASLMKAGEMLLRHIDKVEEANILKDALTFADKTTNVLRDGTGDKGSDYTNTVLSFIDGKY